MSSHMYQVRDPNHEPSVVVHRITIFVVGLSETVSRTSVDMYTLLQSALVRWGKFCIGFVEIGEI